MLVAGTMLDQRHGVEFVLDLTDLHRAEGAALAEWERRDQLEREFVANAAHELRTPLTAIIASVEALDAGARELPDLRDRFFAHIKEQAARLNRLTESLLLLARIETVPEVPRSEVELRPSGSRSLPRRRERSPAS